MEHLKKYNFHSNRQGCGLENMAEVVNFTLMPFQYSSSFFFLHNLKAWFGFSSGRGFDPELTPRELHNNKIVTV